MKLQFKGISFLPVALLFICISCQKSYKANNANELSVASRAKPQPQPSVSPKGNCIYNPTVSEIENGTGGWRISFQDEFNSGLSSWNIWKGGAYNNELQLYQQENLSFINDTLVITATALQQSKEGPTTPWDPTPKKFNYTSGRIESNTNFSASVATPKVRMMARIKLPAGYGMWPAFWSYGDPWPTQGEIDILEARGQEPYKYQTNYFYGNTANRNLVRNAAGYITTDSDLTACYHVYEVIWAQNSLTFYFDGQLVDTKSGGYVPNLFDKKERITLNLAVGGNFFSNLDPTKIVTGSMYVDWVRVFTAP